MVVLLYSDISNFTFWSVNILKCKNFVIGFLDELGNFKQKKITFWSVNFFCLKLPNSLRKSIKKILHFKIFAF